MFHNYIGRNEWIIILSNVLFFMLAQTLFFALIASRQYETVLGQKLDMVKEYAKLDVKFKENLQAVKEAKIIEVKPLATKQAVKRQTVNNNTTWNYCGIPIVVCVAALLFVIFFVKSEREWDNTDNVGMIYVLLAYSTELLFFFTIVQQYEYVGDQHIVSEFVSNISKGI